MKFNDEMPDLKGSDFGKMLPYAWCVVPENIPVYPKESYWKLSKRGGVPKTKIFKVKDEPKLEFPERLGAGTDP